MQILLALIIGSLFGFVLHRVGASNPQNIINMLRLKDFHLMKVILLAIALSSAALFIGLVAGVIDSSHLSVKTSYWGVIVGGALLGIGWAVAGYCPGTGIAAIGEGRKDAIVFALGGLVGALIYMLSYSSIENTFLLDKVFGGKSMLAFIPNLKFQGLIEVIPGLWLVLIIAMILAGIAFVLPARKSEF